MYNDIKQKTPPIVALSLDQGQNEHFEIIYSIHYNSVNRKDTHKKKKKEKIPVWKGKVRLHDFFYMNIRKSVCYCNESIYCF